MKHEHKEHKHKLEYCAICDAAYCSCGVKWVREPQFTITAWGTTGTMSVPAYEYQNHSGTIVYKCAHGPSLDAKNG